MNKERKLMLIIVGIMLAALWSAPTRTREQMAKGYVL